MQYETQIIKLTANKIFCMDFHIQCRDASNTQNESKQKKQKKKKTTLIIPLFNSLCTFLERVLNFKNFEFSSIAINPFNVDAMLTPFTLISLLTFLLLLLLPLLLLLLLLL